MRAYRLVADVEPSRVTASVEVQGWDPDLASWAWMPLDTWAVAVSEPEEAGAELAVSALVRGWDVRATGLSSSTSTSPMVTVPVSVGDYSRVLQALQPTKPLSVASLNLVADLPRVGEPGHVAWNRVAPLLGLERRAVAGVATRFADQIAARWTELDPATCDEWQPRLTEMERHATEVAQRSRHSS